MAVKPPPLFKSDLREVNTLTKPDALKRYFGSEERPVTTKELNELKKSDPAGFDQLADAAEAALGKTA